MKFQVASRKSAQQFITTKNTFTEQWATMKKLWFSKEFQESLKYKTRFFLSFKLKYLIHCEMKRLKRLNTRRSKRTFIHKINYIVQKFLITLRNFCPNRGRWRASNMDDPIFGRFWTGYSWDHRFTLFCIHWGQSWARRFDWQVTFLINSSLTLLNLKYLKRYNVLIDFI